MSIITDIGESVTLRRITASSRNTYGDRTTSVGSLFMSGMIIPMGASEDEVKAGVLTTEDAIGIFPGTESNVKLGNEVYCTLGSFVLQNVQKFVLGGTVHHIEAEMKRVTE